MAPGKPPEPSDANPHPKAPAAAATAKTRCPVHAGADLAAAPALPAALRRKVEAVKNRGVLPVAGAAELAAEAAAEADRPRGFRPLAKELTDMQMTIAPLPCASQ